jgi:hypothetical protein
MAASTQARAADASTNIGRQERQGVAVAWPCVGRTVGLSPEHQSNAESQRCRADGQ